VFFTLFSSLRSYGNDKLYSSFRELDKTCIEVVADKDIANLTETEKNEIEIEIKEKYKDLKDQNGWLWVKNVWKSDTKTSQFVSFKSYANHYDLKDEARDEAKVRYDLITESIEGEKSEPNGFYILIILAVLVSFATQFISTKLLAPKGQQMNMMNKIMMAVIPLSMIIFVLSSNVVFTLYIITNSIMSTLISTVITLIMRRKDKGIDDKDFIMQNKNINVVEYSRNYKK